MCTLKELQDGTYSIYDLEVMHQILDIQQHMKPAEAVDPPNFHGGLGG